MQTTIRTKIILCFALADGATESNLLAGVARETRHLDRSDGLALEYRFASRLTDKELQDLWAGTEDLQLEAMPESDFGLSEYHVADYPSAPYQAALLLAGAPGSIDQLIDGVEGLGKRLEGLYDPGASAAIAGSEETVLAGEGSVIYLNHVRRPPTQSVEDFHSYWRLEHTKLSTQIPHFRGYRQVHAVADASRALAEATGLLEWDFDGTAEGHAYDVDDLITMWNWEVEHKLYEDEANFTDLPRCVMGYFRVRGWTSHV